MIDVQMRNWTVQYEASDGATQLVKVMAPDKEAAEKRVLNRGAVRIISCKPTLPADRIGPCC